MSMASQNIHISWIVYGPHKENSHYLYIWYLKPMTFQDKEVLARSGDDSLDACAARLRAARAFTGLTQMECSIEAGISKTAWNNAERGRNYPSLSALRWLYRAHGIDYNFMMAGDFSRLHQETQGRLFAALASDTNAPDQTGS